MEETMYSKICSLLMTTSQMDEYDIVHSMLDDNNVSPKRSIRERRIKCAYCHTKFKIKENKVDTICKRHPGKYQDGFWSCCNSTQRISRGCVNFHRHVFGFKSALDLHLAIPFREVGNITVDSPPDQSIIGINVRNVYTSLGLEVGRVTLVDFETRRVLYDKYVKPQGILFDTFFKVSGITVADLTSNDEAVSFEQCNSDILNKYVFRNTILIGHCLNNDLNGMRWIHDRVIDTSYLFPIKGRKRYKGFCFKRRHSIKYLAKNVLGMDIQKGIYDSRLNANIHFDLVLAYLEGKRLQ